MCMHYMFSCMHRLEHHPTQHAQMKEQIGENREKRAALRKQKSEKLINGPVGAPPGSSDTESASPPLLHLFHIHSIRNNPKHRTTGERTNAVC